MSSMTATATTAQETKYEIPPSGQQIAVVVGVIDLGTHEQESKAKDGTISTWDRRSVLICWELPACKMTGMKDTNHIIGQEYTISFSNKANLRKMIEGWSGQKFKDGDTFDPDSLLGKQCVVNIVHGKSAKDKAYAKVDSVNRPMKGVTMLPATVKAVLFDILNPKDEIPADLWLPFVYGAKHGDIIKSSKEWKNGRKPLAKPAAGVKDDPEPEPNDGVIPF